MSREGQDLDADFAAIDADTNQQNAAVDAERDRQLNDNAQANEQRVADTEEFTAGVRETLDDMRRQSKADAAASVSTSRSWFSSSRSSGSSGSGGSSKSDSSVTTSHSSGTSTSRSDSKPPSSSHHSNDSTSLSESISYPAESAVSGDSLSSSSASDSGASRSDSSDNSISDSSSNAGSFSSSSESRSNDGSSTSDVSSSSTTGSSSNSSQSDEDCPEIYWVITHWSYSDLDVLTDYPSDWRYLGRTTSPPAPWHYDLYVGCTYWNQQLRTYPHPETGNPVRVLAAGYGRVALDQAMATYGVTASGIPENCCGGQLSE